MIKHPLIDHIPMTGDMVSLWLPSGQNRAIDIIRSNHGQCYGTHPNVPVISTFQPPNKLTDGGLNEWLSATNLTYWTEYKEGTSTINREATEKVEGDYSCRFDVDASNSQVQIYQMNISLTPLKRRKVIIWYENSVAGKTFQFYIRNIGNNVYLKEDGTWNVGSYYITLPNSIVWTAYELPFYVHPDYSSYLMLLSKKLAASSSFYLDKMSIEELKPSLINPSVGWCFGGDDWIDLGTGVGDYPDNFTLGAWVKSLARNVGIITRRQEDPFNQYGFGIKADTGFLCFSCDIGGGGGATSINDGKWHFCLASINGSNSQLYLDAVADGATFDPNIMSSDVKFLIGAWNNGTGGLMDGDIALPFIANKAWSQQQVNNFYLQTRGLFSPRG